MNLLKLSRVVSRFTAFKPVSQPVRIRFYSTNKVSEFNNPDVKTVRNYKRFFAYGLFGVTLLGAFIIKRKRRQEWAELLSKAKRLPNNFGSLPLYEFGGCILPESVVRLMKDISSFKFRDNDVLVVSYPKTGTTWLQEIVYLLVNDLNYEEAKSKSITERFPYLEFPSPGMKTISQLPSPRLIKTHLPMSLLFSDETASDEATQLPKVISIFRNSKDVLVSYYYFSRMNNLIGFKGNFDEFFELFVANQLPYGPIDKHYRDALNAKDDPKWKGKVLTLRYEDLQSNFRREIDTLCDFLGRSRLDQDEMKVLQKHCSFDEMKLNSSVNYQSWVSLGLINEKEAPFMRKGIVGDWEAHFSPSQSARFDKWLEERDSVLRS